MIHVSNFIGFVLVMTVSVNSNTLTKSHFNCWPKSAYFQMPEPFPDCPGVTAYWIDPPSSSKMNRIQSKNVSYFFRVNSTFYSWAVQQGLFRDAGPSGFTNAILAQKWCEDTQCPHEITKANESNCCLHYINLFLCVLHQESNKSVCEPWLQDRGSVSAVSAGQLGPVDTGTWVSHIEPGHELNEGKIVLMVVIRLAGMLAALEGHYQRKLPVYFCGDGICRTDESCDKCPSDCGKCTLTWIQVILLTMGITLLALMVIMVIAFYSRWMQRIALSDETWIVELCEFIPDESRPKVGESEATIVNKTRGIKPDHSYPALSNLVMPINKPQPTCARQVYVATVKGQNVFAKKYYNNKFDLNVQVRKEVLAVRNMVHSNVCQFVGATVEARQLYILYENCPKGSLLDILLNETISLNWTFRFSLLTDASRGMVFLHRHNMIHGNLKSSNCVVDDRWVCKVTDFGLQEYRRENWDNDNDSIHELVEENRERDKMYRAPEADVNLQPGSDVWSFGVIMVEVATRQRASLENEQGEKKTRVSLPPFPPSTSFSMESCHTENRSKSRSSIRPKRNNSAFVGHYNLLIDRCWADKPEDRPEFAQVEAVILRMNPSKKNPMDTIMAMMEMYSKNLEQIVNTRSRQLLEEKHKTEALLYSILPRPVANSLLQGRPVCAESYDDSSVFFSDIVGFTAISSRSSPMQIVELLNKLYTTFDSVIERHNVYKVETIGDAYMVVSGVPRRTKRHAFYLATMALEIMEATRIFVIPHLPSDTLQIKAGCDSGPVCAGVVGSKMPRYCLFGDTVNTASRMESNSKPMFIHVSGSFHKELEFSDLFLFELRGKIPVKGKGEMVTWWLCGRQEMIPLDVSRGSFEEHIGSPADIGFLNLLNELQS